MIKKFLPLLLLLIGAGAGVGAGVFLRPAGISGAAEGGSDATTGEKTNAADIEVPRKEAAQKDEGHDEMVVSGHNATKGESANDDLKVTEFVKMNNQFVVPIVSNDRVAAMVVLALSIEVSTGYSDAVFLREPKLRDSFLQVLFDHANIGGFDGAFTNAQVLGRLRDALREVAQKDLGEEIVKDVLIVEIARQDY